MLESLFSFFLISSPAAVDNYTKILDSMRRIEAAYKQNVQLIQIGDSNSGVPIWGMKIGSGIVNNLIVATHHGNEYGSTAVAMGAIENFAADPIKGRTIYVIPVLNISGYNRGSRYETVGGRSVDPNRDYPGPCGTEGPFQSKATKALADFVESNRIVTSATLHTFSPAVLYPWGVSTHETATRDEATFRRLVQDASVESQYQVGNSTDLLYAADGTYEDYSYWKHGIWSVLFEMGSSHSPSQSELKRLVAENVPGLRRMLENSPNQTSDRHDFEGRCSANVLKRLVLE